MSAGLRRRRVIVAAAIVAVLVAGVAIGVWLVRRRPAQLPQAWQLTTEDVTSEEAAWFISVDGTDSGYVLQTPDHLIAMVLTRATASAASDVTGSVLVALDLATGQVEWTLGLTVPDPSGVSRCTVGGSGALLCVGGDETSKDVELLTVDAETGEVTDRTATGSDVPAAIVPFADDLLVMTRFGELLAMSASGEAAWSVEGPVPAYDPMGIISARAVGDHMLLGYGGELRLLGPDGTMRSGSDSCAIVATADDAWACGRDGGPTIGYDGSAQRLWEEGSELVGSWLGWGSAVLVHDGGAVTLVDPVTGELGQPHTVIDADGTTRVRQSAVADGVLLAAETTSPDDSDEVLGATLTMLDPAADTVRWQTEIDQGQLLTAGITIAGDTFVVAADHTIGLDAATGEVRWEYEGITGDVLDVEGALITFSGSALTGYDVPSS